MSAFTRTPRRPLSLWFGRSVTLVPEPWPSSGFTSWPDSLQPLEEDKPSKRAASEVSGSFGPRRLRPPLSQVDLRPWWEVGGMVGSRPPRSTRCDAGSCTRRSPPLRGGCRLICLCGKMRSAAFSGDGKRARVTSLSHPTRNDRFSDSYEYQVNCWSSARRSAR